MYLLFSKKLKKWVVLLGAFFTLALVYQAAGFLLEEYLKSVETERYIRAMDPQDEAAFRHAFWEAVTYDTKNHTIFSPSWKEIQDMLAETSSDGSGHGTYVKTKKPWVTKKLRGDLLIQAGYTYNSGYYDAMMFKDGRFEILMKWGDKKSLIWAIAKRLVIGVATTGVLVLFLPYLFIGALIALLFFGRVQPLSNQTIDDNGPTIIQQTQEYDSGNDPHASDDGVSQTTNILAVFIICLAIVTALTQRKRHTLRYHAIASRAPPKTRRYTMKRACLVLLVVCGMFAAGVHSQESSLYLQFGTWANGSGSGMSYVYDNPHFTISPFTFLDGSVQEISGRWKIIRSDNLSLSSGPVLGMIHYGQEDSLYVGAEIHLKVALLKDYSLSARYATRHNKSRRLNNLGVIGLTRSIADWKIGFFYQPLRTGEPLNTRLAMRIAKEFPHFTLIGECRLSTLDGKMTAGIDADIPLPF